MNSLIGNNHPVVDWHYPDADMHQGIIAILEDGKKLKFGEVILDKM